VLCIPADVSKSSDVNTAFERVAREWNDVHVLANVAGRNFEGDVVSLDEESWDACLAVNLKSVFLTAKAAWPRMLAQGGGVILNTSSVMGRVGAANAVAYGAAKAAIINLTRCLAVDGGPHGIRANVVCPGVVDTPVMTAVFGKHADPDVAQHRMNQQLPLKRMATADEVAAAFAYLASDDAGYVTGAELVIDGGLSSLLALRG
jgi:meso-butanediol dehydrogenase/(S,S)-butanediol dehydrogenase/diacetyl reductase